jgi:hypothetical protein
MFFIEKNNQKSKTHSCKEIHLCNNLMKKTFKLLNNLDKNTIAIYHGRKIFKEEFLSHVELTKNHLLLRKYAINLCENRYHFLVTFAACATLGQISLFPSSKAKKEIERLSESYFNSYLINDEDVIDLYQQNNKNECKKTKNRVNDFLLIRHETRILL